VFNISSGKTVTLSGLTITNGSFSFGDGGGIVNDHATLTVSNCTVSGNSAVFGGGIWNDAEGGSATLTINNSTVSGNSANGTGGGILNDGLAGSATLTINNSTFSGNSAFVGGGIHINGNSGSATLTINNSTVSGNSANGTGGGISNDHGTLTIGDTILKTGASGQSIRNFGGTVTSHGYNLSSDAAGGDGTTGPGGLLNATGGDGTDIGAFEVQATVCPEPKGFWKNNPAAWPASALPMTLGSQTYNQTELLAILQTPIKGDASLILADQLIAAKLNIANANGTPVASTTADADAVLSLYTDKLPYMVRPSTTNGQRMVNDANALDSYNNGVMTPGCTP
jgi:parallel beta helix pectate lyase-like protein